MKFLEVDSLDVLNTVFRWETGEASMNGRIEAYSCKSAGLDKKLFKQIEHKYNVDLSGGSISPDDLQMIISPFGRLDQSTPRMTFFYLLATLNAAFPEHDFSDVRPEQFSKQPSPEMVINSVNTTLFNLDIEDDPMNDEEGYLWSINYFFFNRKMKRLIFFSIKSER
ncbi:Maf1 regulator-domain-containing protein [Spinellus fusiger]|nr:Maf1 regulator-domain-containing protein [Spinellus fusiger]